MLLQKLTNLAVGAAIAVTCSLVAPGAHAEELRFFSGPPQGTWRAISDQLSAVIRAAEPDEQVTILPGGGLANVIAVEQGQGDIGLAVSTPVYMGLEGVGPFKEPTENVRLLATLHYIPYFVITLDGDIKQVSDLKGKRVSVSPKGFASEALTQSILPVAGLSYDDIDERFLGEVESGEALRNGQIDAFAIYGNTEYAIALDLATTGRLHFVPFTSNQLNTILETQKGLFPYEFEAGHFEGVDKKYTTFAASLMLIANASLSDARAEGITKAIVEGLPQLKETFGSFRAMTPDEMAKDVGVPFHPGAEAYYDKTGLAN